METLVSKNGKGNPKDANQKDSAAGAAVLAKVTAIKVTENPYLEKVNKIGALQRKVLQLQNLREMEGELRKFELSTEDGQVGLTLEDAKRNSFDIGNAYLIGKVKEVLHQEFAAKIPQLEAEILAATI